MSDDVRLRVIRALVEVSQRDGDHRKHARREQRERSRERGHEQKRDRQLQVAGGFTEMVVVFAGRHRRSLQACDLTLSSIGTDGSTTAGALTGTRKTALPA